MKVLMISVFPPMRAPEADHALHLCEHLADYGLEMHVVAQKGCIIPSHPRITVYPLMRRWSWSELPKLVWITLRCSPDAVLLIYVEWIYRYQPMITFTPTVLKNFRPNVTFVTLFEDEYGTDPGVKFLTRALRKAMAQFAGPEDVDYNFGTLLRDSNRLIVVSDRTRAVLAKQFAGVNRKSIRIPSPPIMRILPEDGGTTRRLKRTDLGLKEDEFLIAYFGYIYEGKGVETLLQAFHKMNTVGRRVRLIIVGGTLPSDISTNLDPTYPQRIYERSTELGIEDKVIWAGGYEWDSDEASRCLRAADICVLPYDRGVCIHNSSLAGAAAHGMPIITTQGSITEPVFIHKSNIFLCPPKDADALAQAMEMLMTNSELRHRLSIGALELAQEWFSWGRAIERTIAVLKGETACAEN